MNPKEDPLNVYRRYFEAAAARMAAMSQEAPATQTATATAVKDDPRREATKDRLERARLILELIDARRRLYNDPNLDRYWERQILAEMEREIDETPKCLSLWDYLGGMRP